MNKNEWTKWVGVVGRMLLAYALVFAQGPWAAQNQATKDKSGSPQKAAAPQAKEKQPASATAPMAQSKQAQAEEAETSVAEEKPSGDASHQGIKVHGHWTIEVRNPDGALVTHREFENSLFTPQFALSSFLARKITVGTWAIVLNPGPAGNICSNSAGPGPCFIVEPNASPSFSTPAPISFPNLVISTAGSNFVLSGTAVANITGSVGYVYTQVGACTPDTSPSSCMATAIGASGITIKQVTPEILVSTGQTVAVSVNISFS